VPELEQDKFKFLREEAPWMDAVHAILGEDCKLHYMGCMLSQVPVWVCMLVCACVCRCATAVLSISNVCFRAVVVVRIRVRASACLYVLFVVFLCCLFLQERVCARGSYFGTCLLVCACSRPAAALVPCSAGLCVL
jgi:hypothetical protein